MTDKVEMPHERFFRIAEHTGTRGHKKKLFKKRVGTYKRHFFSARVVDKWNKLDDKTISATSVNAFKRKLGEIGY